jgi:hypothetical protein
MDATTSPDLAVTRHTLLVCSSKWWYHCLAERKIGMGVQHKARCCCTALAPPQVHWLSLLHNCHKDTAQLIPAAALPKLTSLPMRKHKT